MEIEAVFWDIDDTLVKTTDTIKLSRLEALRTMMGSGLPIQDVSQGLHLLDRIMFYFHSSRPREFLEVLCKECSVAEEYVEELAEIGREAYERSFATISAADYGVEALEATREVVRIQGVISNGIRSFQYEKLAKSGLEHYFNPVFILMSSDKPGTSKPLPGMFFEAQRRGGFSAHSAVYVGDSLTDIIAANLAGWISVWCPYQGRKDWEPDPFDSLELTIENPSYRIDSLKELPTLLLHLGAVNGLR